MAGLTDVRRPVSSLPVVARVAIPGFPDWVGLDEAGGAVWVSNRDRDSVARIDAGTNRLAGEVRVGSRPCCGLALGHGSLWVPCCGDGTVSRVDPSAGRVAGTVAVGAASSEGAIAADAAAVWLPAAGPVLARIDPARGVVAARVPLPDGSFAAAAGFGAVWVSSTAHGAVTRVDPATNAVTATIAVGPAPRFLAAGLGAVWVLNQGDGTVSRIDPSAGRVVATVEVDVPGEGGDIAVGEGSVWVTALGKPLARIDPATNRVAVQFVGEGGDAVRAGLGAVWLCSFGLQQLWRIDPGAL